jgi:hypothetical protein
MQKYKIIFFGGEDEKPITITELEYFTIRNAWELHSAFEVKGELYARSSIKRIVKMENFQDQLRIEEPESPGIPSEKLAKIRKDFFNRNRKKEEDSHKFTTNA